MFVCTEKMQLYWQDPLEENNVSSCELLAGHNVHESMKDQTETILVQNQLKSGFLACFTT